MRIEEKKSRYKQLFIISLLSIYFVKCLLALNRFKL